MQDSNNQDDKAKKIADKKYQYLDNHQLSDKIKKLYKNHLVNFSDSEYKEYHELIKEKYRREENGEKVASISYKEGPEKDNMKYSQNCNSSKGVKLIQTPNSDKASVIKSNTSSQSSLFESRSSISSNERSSLGTTASSIPNISVAYQSTVIAIDYAVKSLSASKTTSVNHLPDSFKKLLSGKQNEFLYNSINNSKEHLGIKLKNLNLDLNNKSFDMKSSKSEKNLPISSPKKVENLKKTHKKSNSYSR